MRPEHLQALGLDLPPFGPGPAGRFYFATPALTQRLDLLHHLVQHSDLLLAVIAPPGSGKTSLLAKVLESAGPQWRVCPITPVGSMGIHGLLDRIMAGLDVPQRGRADGEADERLRRLALHLEAVAAAGDLAAVFIDDADRLEDDALELAIQLALRSRHLKARIVLAGPPVLGERVRALAARDGAADLVHLVELPPFTEEQTGDYLHTRLREAGMRGDSPFGAATVAAIRRESKGRPARINELALSELAAVAARRSERVRRSRVTGVLMQWWKGIAIVAVAGVMLALTIVLLPPQAPTRGRAAPPPRIVDLAAPAPAPGDAAPATQASAPSVVASGEPIPVPDSLPAGGDEASEEPDPALIGAREALVTDPQRVPPGPSASEPPVPAPPMPLPPAPPARAENGPVPPVSQEPVPAGETAPTPAAAPPPPPRTAAGGERPATEPNRPARAPIRTVHWLRAQSPGHFTIQLLGTHSDEAMYRYIEGSRIGSDGAWFRARHQGKPWYVVVYGVYPSRAEAESVAAGLPKRLAPGPPWVRTIASVLESIDSHRPP